LEGNKVYEGTMVDLKPDELTLEYMDKTRQKTIVIPRKQIAQARLAIKF
jgi:ribosome maturation factor RimP